jgi:phosphatidylserine/phosphatidylglycerophosphate/cardiolipin synthase-like enzyme
MFRFWNRADKSKDLLSSALHDESTFYKTFLKDLASCEKEIVIVSPFITNSRAQILRPILQRQIERGVIVTLITRHPNEHDENMTIQAEGEIAELEMAGVKVLFATGNHHQKLAILDREILWEGSLNIMSQVRSREVMRRIKNKHCASEMLRFLKFKNF